MQTSTNCRGMSRLRAVVNPEAFAKYKVDTWIRVNCDCSADGVWAEGGGSTSPVYLPIPIGLVDRIFRWQAVHETNEGYDTEGEHWTDERFRAFTEKRLSIAIEMMRHLPDRTIVYHYGSRTPSDGPLLPGEAWMDRSDRLRPWLEYKITPEVVATGRAPDNYPGK